MPLYEYACSACPTEFETLVFPGDRPEEVECPSCHSHEVKRKLSATAAPQTVTSGGACATNLPPCSPTCCRLPS